MHSARFFALLLASSLALVIGCGGTPESAPDEDLNKLSLKLAPFDVPPGESFICVYTDTITDRELNVVRAKGTQSTGGHHLTLYYVDTPREPHSTPCSGTAEMVDWHFVVGAGGEADDGNLVALAEGLAIKVPPGKQLLLQAHYINTTGATMTVADALDVETVDPSVVKAYASDFVVNDEAFEIQPNAGLTSEMTCVVPQDVKLTLLLGHMHEHGVHYKLDTVDATGNLINTLYEETWAPSYASHPPILKRTMDDPLIIKAGTRLHQTCTWDNTSPNLLLFPTEMCIAFGYYFPGNGRVLCERDDEKAAP
jgi:hypothetical protein